MELLRLSHDRPKNTRTGRYSTDADEVMTHVRKPVFVDNAIHHGRISVRRQTRQRSGGEENTRNLQVMPQRNYRILEGEFHIQLSHNNTPGHSPIRPLSLLMI